MQIKTIGRSSNNKVDKQASKERMDALRKEHSVLKKGKFEFVDAKGGWIDFAYRFFPEDILVTYRFVHDEICEIPMGLVKHINNTVQKVRKIGHDHGAERGNELPSRGLPTSYQTNSRIRFIPMDVL